MLSQATPARQFSVSAQQTCPSYEASNWAGQPRYRTAFALPPIGSSDVAPRSQPPRSRGPAPFFELGRLLDDSIDDRGSFNLRLRPLLAWCFPAQAQRGPIESASQPTPVSP